MTHPMHLLLLALAGLVGGLLALATGIPAAPLAGALVGAAVLSLSGRVDPAQWPAGTRTALEIAIGTVIGSGLTAAALGELRQLWRPALLITLTLVLTGLVVGLWCSRLLGIRWETAQPRLKRCLLRRRRRRLKPKAVPAPSRGRGPGTWVKASLKLSRPSPAGTL